MPDETSVHCSECDRVFGSAHALTMHRVAVHGYHTAGKPPSLSPLDHLCAECGRGFDSPQGLSLHRRRAHEGFQPIPRLVAIDDPELVGATVVTLPSAATNGHESAYPAGVAMQTHSADGDALGDLPCPECSLMFKTETGLSRHLNRKHGGNADDLFELVGKATDILFPNVPASRYIEIAEWQKRTIELMNRR